MKLSYSRQIILFIFVWFAWSQQSFGQQTTVNFDSYTENQGLSNPHVEGELRFEAIKGVSATCTVCVGVDINEGKNGGPGLDDSNQEIGGIIGWKISRADDASFQFLSIWLQDRDISNTLGTSDAGTIKAFKGGAQVGNTKAINFDSGTSGLKSFATDPDFFNVDHILIEGVDLFLILDDVTYNVPFIDGSNTAPTVLAVNLIGAPLSTATSVTYNVEFSKIAENVTADDFELTKTGSAIGTIAAVTGSNATYSVLVTGLSGEGTIRLDIKAGTDISNENNVTGTAAFTSGQIHHVSPCLIEDFEDETDASKTFSLGGNNFSITGNLEVHTETPSIGINGSRFVLLNTGSGPYLINSLTKDINLKKFAVFLSSEADGNNPTNDGSITVVGKKDGSQVYSITKSSGFPVDFSANSGYYIFDLRTEGGSDNSTILIDQLEISLGSAFQYINIDNFEFCLDAIDPVISNCPIDIIVSNDEGVCSAAVTWTEPTATDNSGSVNFISNIAPGTVFEVGTTMVTYTATDGAGNQATCSFEVKVNDTNPPVPPTSPGDLNLSCASDVPAPYELTAIDNCSGEITVMPTVTQNSTGLNSFTITYEWTFIDASGNAVFVDQKINVSDNTEPVAPAAPGDLTLQCASEIPQAVTLTATDNCSGPITISPTEQTIPGSSPDDFTMVRTWTFIDASGNLSSVSQTITVKDITPPVLVLQDVTVVIGPDGTADGNVFSNGALVSSSDNCGLKGFLGGTESSTYTCADLGSFTVTVTAFDFAGNQTSETYVLTVTDPNNVCNVPPVAVAKPLTISADANCEGIAAAVDFDGGSTDANGDLLTFSVSPAEPYPLGVTNVTLSVSDGLETSQATTTITVVDDTAPVITVITPTPTAVLGLSNAVTMQATDIFAATDNCSGDLVFSPTAFRFDCDNLGDNTVSVSVTDAAGNTANANATVNISDNVALTIDASESGTPVPVGSDAVLKATVSPAAAGVMVTFLLDGVTKGTVITDGSGMAILTVPAAELGSLPVVYKVSATVEECTGLSQSVAYLPIYDPNGNFVTGGGWIMSPAGAYKADESLTGKANFGFVSKYKKGSNQVDGNTEFQFKAGDLNFKSMLHESGTLVISGKKATYRGEGMINDVPGYKFTLVALDGDWNGGTDPDQFRIKIWGASGIVYDNGLGADDNSDVSTVLGGGSITIHEAKGKGKDIRREINDPTTDALENSFEEMELSDEPMAGEFRLYPNPAQKETSVMVDLDQGATVAIRIYDAVGRLVIENEAYREGSFVQIFNLDGLAAGFYTVQVKAGDILMIKRLIKE